MLALERSIWQKKAVWMEHSMVAGTGHEGWSGLGGSLAARRMLWLGGLPRSVMGSAP